MTATTPVSNPLLVKRICSGGYPASAFNGCRSGDRYSGGCCYEYSSWYWWGRWVFAGIVIVFFIFLLALIACINSRRRRKRGLAPRYGTGWMAPPKYTPGNYGQPAPPYAPPGQNPSGGYNYPQQTGNTFQTTDGYYGQGHGAQNPYGSNQEGIQLQPPQNSYYPRGGAGEGGAGDYAPPAGPPPGK